MSDINLHIYQVLNIYKLQRRNMFRSLILLLFSFFLVQCKEPSPEQIKINERHKEIMVIHDEVMPKMKDIYTLKKGLKKADLPQRYG